MNKTRLLENIIHILRYFSHAKILGAFGRNIFKSMDQLTLAKVKKCGTLKKNIFIITRDIPQLLAIV